MSDRLDRFLKAQNRHERELALGGEPPEHPGAPTPPAASPDHRLYVNQERTILLTIWKNGTVTVAHRATTGNTWGPPVTLRETP